MALFALLGKAKIDDVPDFVPEYRSKAADSEIAFDVTRKIAALRYSKGLFLVPFAEIVSAEVIVNDRIDQKTNRGSQLSGAAIGALILGPIGLLAGALSGSKTNYTKINKIAVRVLTKRFDQPVHDLDMFTIGGKGMAAGWVTEQYSNQAIEWAARFGAIIALNESGQTG